MTITSVQSNMPLGQAKYTTGSWLDNVASPAAAVINLGWNPRYFKWLDATNRVQWEWFDGMAQGTSLKTVAAGTRTLDTADTAFLIAQEFPVDAHAGLGTGPFGPPTAANPGTPTTQFEIFESPPGEQGGGVITVSVTGTNSLILQNAQIYWEARS